MTLAEKIDTDIKEAMKAKDGIRLSTLRMLKAGIKNLEIEKKAEKLEDKDVTGIISKQIKQHKDSIDGFTKGNRQDLVEKEAAELKILESYMPKMLSADELKPIVKNAIASVEAKGRADMGKVMKAAMEEAKGAADGKMLSQMVAEELAKLG
ncbi:MAG: GatB/YqeY domain-containing protein [Candidatus Omnitrophica bacterium]|nr:GatB/YqeY domain-containing protein [Candidatus Omnitrophota bacterium]MDD5311164.1 GatB/YqeY domain-containing protein [Candidatus Omnitrophota bacterium]MDD5546923.1 GatB/YqeY domain-containing protein [Candidatus Omnitrophota bacterium]